MPLIPSPSAIFSQLRPTIYGYEREEFLSLHSTDISAETEKTVKRITSGFGTVPLRYHRKKDGTIFPVEISASFFELSGRKTLCAAIRDITERKQSEDALRESEEKYRQLFEMESDAIFLIRKNDGRILEVNAAGSKLYGFSREELQKMKNTDISIEPDFTQKATMEEEREIPSDSAIVLADPTQINQIMINLCTNAAHAMEEDGGVLEINLDSMTLDESTAQSYELSFGRYIKLTVNDTGHGIDPEIKDRIFDPYFTTREIGKGSGMGLAVVHGIVMNHDGAITVDSEVGKGTTFNVFFPIVERESVPEITIDEDLPIGKEAILFVDDEESILKMRHQQLERLGYKVESTTSPIEALDLFRSKSVQFDLVITDLTMPKMTGDKLVKEILNIRPDIPIIICTGFSEKMNGEKATAIGASGYLEKPHEKRDLAITIRQVLDEQ
jgi:PAS domain S-box-containing protein